MQSFHKVVQNVYEVARFHVRIEVINFVKIQKIEHSVWGLHVTSLKS